MTMQVKWEESDITAGRVVGHPRREEKWRIGYIAAGDDDKWVLVSQIDGMVQPPVTRAKLAENLNKTGDIPVELFER